MYRRKRTVAVILSLAMGSVLALAQPVDLLETITLPADDADGVWTTTVLDTGVRYWIRAEGVYTHALAGQMADAEWDQYAPGGAWTEASYSPVEHDLMLDGVEGDWWGSAATGDPAAEIRTYDPHYFSAAAHSYWRAYIGVGGPMHLQIQDVDHSDNSGALTIEIWSGGPGPIYYPDEILVASVAEDAVVVVEPASGAQRVLAELTGVAPDFTPTDVSIARNKDILVVAFDPHIPGESDGAVFRVDYLTGAITTVVPPGTVLVKPFGITRDIDGTFLVTDQNFSVDWGAIYRVDAETCNVWAYYAGPPLDDPGGITVYANGDVFTSDVTAGLVCKWPPFPAEECSAPDGGTPYAIDLLSSGDAAVAHSSYAGGSVCIIPRQSWDGDSGTCAAVVHSSGGLLSYPTGIAVDRAGDMIVSCYHSASLVRVDAETGTQETIATGDLLGNPRGLEVAYRRFFAGDLNCDGLINNADIDPFVLALTGLPQYALSWPNCNHDLADLNGDGLINNGDIDAFIGVLAQ